jgi:translation initiation factor IF-2
MAKARKPFISRKKRKEMTAARERRENMMNVREKLAVESTAPLTITEKTHVQLPPAATVSEFSKQINLPVVKVISALMRNGMLASINDRIDYDTMAIIGDELGIIPEPQQTETTATETITEKTNIGTEIRPPVVTIMGHVDHGKTSLLDKIRQTNIAAKEAGGITQHIGAYQAEVTYEGKPRLITFLDTPGHEAFTALRSHGAQVTDIVILVVAADDGVKPQTIEAINHAKSAHVPIIVALTKVDLPTANIERVKQQLTEYSLIAEEWGGETVMVGVSATTGEGIEQLLEYSVLTADVIGYKADPLVPAQGVVIESHQEVGLGPVATVLIQNGTLRLGDVIVIGQTHGKIRAMLDFRGDRLTEALPSTPVRISGIQMIPNFGESFAVAKDEREAKLLASQTDDTSTHRNIGDISRAIAEGKVNTLNIILKADAQGSLEAIRNAISKISEPGVKTIIVHAGIGDITLSDIQLATASLAVVFGFHVSISPQIKRAAENAGITLQTFTIIYDLLQHIELTLKGKVKMKTVSIELGRLKVKKIFRSTRDEQIIGGEITQGIARTNVLVSVHRQDSEVGNGKVTSLQKGPEAVNELEAGQDCGLAIATGTKINEGDVIVFSTQEQVISREDSID